MSNNFGENNVVEHRSALECEFVAQVDPEDQSFPNLACADFDADTCSIEVVVEPTEAPVDTPAPATPTMTEGGGTEQGEEPTMAPPPTAVPTSSASAVRLIPGIFGVTVSLIAMTL